MKHFQCKLVFSTESCRIGTKDQKSHKYKQIIIVLIALLLPVSAKASVPCSGRFVNPISDVCWSCLLPISIGPLRIGGGMVPSKRDTSNPGSPLCMCIKGTPPLPVPGITLGFWEPVRLISFGSNSPKLGFEDVQTDLLL